jgi:hypothetical protein
MDLFQGSALPSTISTTQKQQTSPEFYTNYLQDITNLGQNAVNQAGVAGLSPLQMQAFQMAPQAAFAGAGSMGAGSTLLGQAGTTTAPDVVQDYMNPYTKNVVDEMSRQQGLNIQRNIMPGLSAAGASTGNFGSSRMANATGQTLADMQANLTGQQYTALNQGYKDATSAAQNDLTRAMQAGQGLGNLGAQQNQISLAGLNELSTLGGQEQAQGQKIMDMPMLTAQKYADLLQKYQIPIGETTQSVAPGTQGNYTNSPLSQIAGLGSLFQSLYPNTSANTAADLANYAATAKNRGYKANNDGTWSSADGTQKYDAFLNPIAAEGGLISSYYTGGSVSNNIMNDAMGGNVYDQYGNMIG